MNEAVISKLSIRVSYLSYSLKSCRSVLVLVQQFGLSISLFEYRLQVSYNIIFIIQRVHFEFLFESRLWLSVFGLLWSVCWQADREVRTQQSSSIKFIPTIWMIQYNSNSIVIFGSFYSFRIQIQLSSTDHQRVYCNHCINRHCSIIHKELWRNKLACEEIYSLFKSSLSYARETIIPFVDVISD